MDVCGRDYETYDEAPEPIERIPGLLCDLVVCCRSATAHRAAGDLLRAVRIHALGDGIALLGLQRAKTIVQRFHLGLGQQEATARMNLGDQCVLVVRGS